MPDVASRYSAFTSAVTDLAQYVGNGLAKPEIADAMQEMAQANGLTDLANVDDVQTVIADAFAYAEQQQPYQAPPSGNGQHAPAHGPAKPSNKKLRILSKAQYLASLRLPD